MNEKITEQSFYPNVEYNKANRRKFFTMMILLMASLGVVIGLMVSINQMIFAVMFGVILLVTLFLIPSAIKSHPVKADVPVFTVKGREITVQDRTYSVKDIEFVSVTAMLFPVSKLTDENKAYVESMAEKYPEEKLIGNVDIRLKKGLAKKGQDVIYTTCDDCLGACAALVGAGVKHYGIVFNLKKINVPAKFSITKVETKKQTLGDVSEKERRKQLI